MESSQNSQRLSKKLLSLESPKDFSEFFRSFKDLFKENFISNCHLDDASVTIEELETLEELDHAEVLENFKDLLESLLTFKTNCKADSSGELATRCEQLEKMLQKQESEVRTHIRNEHQLKLHIDTTQQKFKELEDKYQEAQMTIKEMESKGCESMQTKLKKIEDRFHKEITKVSSKYRSETESGLKEFERIQKLEEMYEKKEKSYTKLKQDFVKMKILLEETTKECKNMKKEMEKHCMNIISSDALTKRKEDNDKSFSKVHIVIKSTTIDKKRSHMKKKSNEILFQYSKHPIDPTPPESRPHNIIKASLYNSRRHIRSQSEYSRPHSSKKIYSKY